MNFTDHDIDEIVVRLRERGRAEAREASWRSRALYEAKERQEAPGRRRRDIRIASSLIGFCVLQVADAVTTVRALRLPKMVEANPFAVPMLTLGPAGYVVKLATAAAMTKELWSRRADRRARITIYALTTASLYAVVNNLHWIRRAGRR